jgi:plasmid stabilization system protein ParE
MDSARGDEAEGGRVVRQIVWSDEASRDLEEIKDYVSQSSPANAEGVVMAMIEAADRLAIFPYAHRMIPELRDPDRRETIVYRWRLMYRVLPDRIRIVGVIHGARLLSNIPDRSFEEGPQQEYAAS